MCSDFGFRLLFTAITRYTRVHFDQIPNYFGDGKNVRYFSKCFVRYFWKLVYSLCIGSSAYCSLIRGSLIFFLLSNKVTHCSSIVTVCSCYIWYLLSSNNWCNRCYFYDNLYIGVDIDNGVSYITCIRWIVWCTIKC